MNCVQIASPEGLTTFCARYPSLRVVCTHRSTLCYIRFKVICRSQGGLIKVSMKKPISFLVWATLVKDGKSL